MTETALEQALRQSEGTESGAQVAFLSSFLATEIFVVLANEATGDQISPQIFETEDGPYVLGFDRIDTLAGFSSEPLPYVGISGRALAKMLDGQEIGVMLSLGDGETSGAISPPELSWLMANLPESAKEVAAEAIELAAPTGLPEQLLVSLGGKLAAAQGAAAYAYLASATYATGPAHLLAFVDPAPGAEPALVALVNEALAFSGIDAGSLDVAFFDAADPMAARLARVGLGFEIPKAPQATEVSAPGTDPKRPPKLR